MWLEEVGYETFHSIDSRIDYWDAIEFVSNDNDINECQCYNFFGVYNDGHLFFMTTRGT
jgi:hypothetical protein